LPPRRFLRLVFWRLRQPRADSRNCPLSYPPLGSIHPARGPLRLSNSCNYLFSLRWSL
jgi:hypothetical protein